MDHSPSRNRKIVEVIAIPAIVTLLVMLFVSFWGGFVGIGLTWFAPAWIACEVALNKDRGRWWGFCLGWLGVVIAAAIGPGRSHEMNQLELRQMQLQVRELEQRLADGEPRRLEP
jgi:hypothetical protein